MSEPLTLVLASLAVFVAAFLQGVTGFGHALIAIGFLSALFGPKEAVLVLTLIAPVIAVAYFLKMRREVDWREVACVSLPLCLIGLPLGIWLFDVIEPDHLGRAVGALLIVSAGYFLSPWAPRPRKLPYWICIVASSLAGFLAGLASTGGPPMVLYLYAKEMDKRVRIAVIQGVFVIGSTIKVLQVAAVGMFTTESLVHAAWMTPPIVAGVLLGAKLMPRIPADLLRKAALVLLLVIGVVMVF
ncbi:MAG: sulfite exporter TauE/SafE family protein [Planctomycetota bacterium]